MEINVWLQDYLKNMEELFGPRLLFVGLQGSYARGEETENSDIDLAVILGSAAAEDLRKYRFMLDTLPDREKVCGFISGKQEILNWERSDIFQFYYDTTPLLGSIDYLKPLIGSEDVRRAIRIGACNIYHMCGHNIVHEKSKDLLKALYKQASFTIQAVYFEQTGTYVRKKAELMPLLEPQAQKILLNGIMLKKQPGPSEDDFERLSELLFCWAAELIVRYRVTEAQQAQGLQPQTL